MNRKYLSMFLAGAAALIPLSCSISGLPQAGTRAPASNEASPVKSVASASPAATSEKYFSSIVWCVMENHGFDEVKDLGASQFLMAHGAVLSNYKDVGHPSGPNYRIMVSGRDWTRNETFGQSEPTVATELQPLGVPTIVWSAWGDPAIRHDPYHDLLSRVQVRSGAFDPDQLPAEAQVYLGADDMDNAHDGTLDTVDQHLTGLIQKLDQSKWFNTADAEGRYPVLAVTWDESMTGDDRVFTAFYGRGVKAGFSSGTAYNHYDFCRTLTDNWGLSPLADAASVSPISDIWK